MAKFALKVNGKATQFGYCINGMIMQEKEPLRSTSPGGCARCHSPPTRCSRR